MRRNRRNDWLIGEPLLATSERLKSECRNSPPLGVDSVWRKASGDDREPRIRTTGNSPESRLESEALASPVATAIREGWQRTKEIATTAPTVIPRRMATAPRTEQRRRWSRMMHMIIEYRDLAVRSRRVVTATPLRKTR